MIETSSSPTRRSNGAVPAARRLVGLERHYCCRSCGGERDSWTRLASCPDCGTAFLRAVIRRAAVAA